MHEAHIFHQVVAALGSRLRDGERGSPGNFGGNLEAVHPVVRTNPVTGWKSVFVNPGFTKRIVGVTRDESDMILGHLFGLVHLNHDLQVRFKWEKVRAGDGECVCTRLRCVQNSVAIWDNRSNYHTVTADYGQERRVGNRVVSLVRYACSIQDSRGALMRCRSRARSLTSTRPASRVARLLVFKCEASIVKCGYLQWTFKIALQCLL